MLMASLEFRDERHPTTRFIFGHVHQDLYPYQHTKAMGTNYPITPLTPNYRYYYHHLIRASGLFLRLIGLLLAFCLV